MRPVFSPGRLGRSYRACFLAMTLWAFALLRYCTIRSGLIVKIVPLVVVAAEAVSLHAN